jgi:hypothetical protein
LENWNRFPIKNILIQWSNTIRKIAKKYLLMSIALLKA